jgi:hypothetical protein
MTITELVLVVSCVLNILTILLVFLVYRDTLTLKSSVRELHVGLITSLNKVQGIEHLTNKIGTSLAEFINLTGNAVEHIEMMIGNPRGKHLYKTSDGKYAATSIEELINKIKDSNEDSKYFSEDELNKLRNMFDDDDDEDDDDTIIN